MKIVLNKQTHEYKVDGLPAPGVTEILGEAGIVDTQWYNDEGRVRGEYVHRAIEIYHKQGLNFSTLDPVLVPYVEAYLDFMTKTGFRPIYIEKPFADPVYRYAGTPDLIGYLIDALVLIDIKTGAVPKWTGLQTAAYVRAVGNKIDSRPIVARYGLELKKNGKWSMKPFKNPRDIDVFLSALTVYNYKKGRV